MAFLLSISLVIIFNAASAQITESDKGLTKSYFKFQARLKGGIGQTFVALPMNFNPVTINGIFDSTGKLKTVSDSKNDFLETKWGPYGGANMDFYFHPNFGFGVDFDYFGNKLKFITPQFISTFLDENPGISLAESNRKNQSFIFVGIGPSFKIFTSKKWDVDFNIRGGLSHLQMGSLTVSVQNLPQQFDAARNTILVYDYSKAMNVIGAKAGLYANYWFNGFVGVTVGVDFVHSFVQANKINDDPDYILQYKDPQYFTNTTGKFNDYLYFSNSIPLDTYQPGKMNINHFSASVGVVFKIAKGIKEPGVKRKDIVVLVKDSLTSIPVADVEVSLRDNKGTVLRTLKTESNGKVNFEDVEKGDYLVSGVKGELITSRARIENIEFNKKGQVIYKELLLNDLRFILAGVTVQCKNSDKPIGKVTIELTNTTSGKVLTVVSDDQGKFSFNLEPNSDYSISGNKDGYFSGIQEITTKGLDRSKTLYVRLVLCVEELKTDQIFVLPIYYDFDKCTIRQDASVELDRLVGLMNKYQKMEVELSSHTDQRGTDAYNNKLSQCRAESAVDYILGKGISKERITAVGYGKTRILEDCTKIQGCPTDSKGDCPCHQKNRRTEVKIIRM